MISIIGSGTLTPRSDALLDLVVDLANRGDLEPSGQDDSSALAAARDLLSHLDYAVAELDALDLATLRWMRGSCAGSSPGPTSTTPHG